MQKMLADEFGTASNIKSRVNRQSVLGAITSCQQRLKLYNRVSDGGPPKHAEAVHGLSYLLGAPGAMSGASLLLHVQKMLFWHHRPPVQPQKKQLVENIGRLLSEH